MNTEEFQGNLDFIHSQVDSVLAAKGDEYAGQIDNDRLHNFKVAAGMQGITVKEALAGMMAKHTTSIYDMIGDGRDYSLDKWDEKILDHINYLILLRAIILEEKGAKVFDVNTAVQPTDVSPELAEQYLDQRKTGYVKGH